MTASPDVRLQANFKLPNGDLINVYGRDAFDFKANLEALIDTAQLVSDTGNLLRGAQTVVNAGLTSQPTQQQQAAAVQQYQQAAVQQPDPAPAPGAPGPVCKHGPMVYKTGNGKRGVWKAYMCAAGSSAPDKCDPQWID